MRTVTVEILHPCGDWARGQHVRLEGRRAGHLERTGYARILETATVQPAETAEARPPVRPTRRVERRG